MCRLNVKFALGQNVPDSFTNRIVGFILGETRAQSSSTSSVHVFTLFPHIIVFVIINSHQSVQIPVNAFHIRRLNCYLGSSYRRRCRELA